MLASTSKLERVPNKSSGGSYQVLYRVVIPLQGVNITTITSVYITLVGILACG